MLKIFIRIQKCLFSAILAWCALNVPAAAGGGPENLFLVVNPKSPDSLNVANHFIQLRHIPAGNVLYLPWNPKAEEVAIDGFRSQILNPIFEAIAARRLSAQIDYIVYSCDFPWLVLFDSDLNRFKNAASQDNGADKNGQNSQTSVQSRNDSAPKVASPPRASLNGLTYLWQSVLKGEADYLGMQSNRYIRLPVEEQKDMPTLGFRSAWQFGPQGELSSFARQKVHALYGPGSDRRPRQYGRRNFEIPQTQCRSRRHSPSGYNLFCKEH